MTKLERLEAVERAAREMMKEHDDYCEGCIVGDALRFALAALPVEEDAPLPHTRRWNVEPTDDGLRVCRGEHSKAEECEWERFVPAPAPEPAPTGAWAGVNRSVAPPVNFRDLGPQSPEDLARLVKTAIGPEPAPRCERCGGSGNVADRMGEHSMSLAMCPSCGGSGTARGEAK